MKKQLLTITCTAFLAGLTCLNLNAQTLPKDECETVLNFDGEDDFVDIGNVSSLNFSASDIFSVEAWFKTKGNLTILSKADGVSPYKGYQLLVVGNGAIAFGLTNSYTEDNDLEVRSTTIDLNDDNWHHVVCTYDGSSNGNGVTIYIDGIKEINNITANTLSGEMTTDFSFQIGARGGNRLAEGSVASIGIWSRVLIAEDVLQLQKNSADLNDPALISYYDFNDGKNSTVLTDYGTEKNHGTLTNMDPMVDWTKADGSEDTRSFSSNTIEKCGYYMWNGMKLTESGEYKHIIPNAAGCDSVMTLDLTINQIPDTAITMNGTELISNAENVEYKWYDCDLEEFVVDANAQSYIPEKNGSYAVLVSNDKCADTSACTSVLITDLDNEIFTNDFDLFPNPTSGTVKIVNSNPSDAFTVLVRDVIGVTVFSGSYTAATIDLNIEQSGVYLVNITSASGVKKDFRLVVQ